LAGLCYACGSPDHRSGEGACLKGKKGGFKQKGRLQVTIQERQQHKGAQAQAFTTHTETENFSENNEYYFAS